jgi:glycosyltransferase involved in cell wall biosynthesis
VDPEVSNGPEGVARPDSALLDREHLERLVAELRVEARENAAARSDLEAQLAAAQHEIRALSAEKATLEKTALARRLAAQDTEIGRLRSERSDLKAELTRSKERIKALESNLVKWRERYKALEAELARSKGRNKALEAELAALRNTSTWLLTTPLRAAKLLASDPRGAIALLRARGSDVPARSAASPPAVERPPAPERKKPLPGLEGMTPAEVERVKAAFDADFYLKQYPDVAERGVDPFEHYMRAGWKAGRDPSPAFSTSYYLRNTPEVEKTGTNPFVHWIFHGMREGRQAVKEQRLRLLDYTPKVTAIVPNYNHAQFLERRLDSILAQTYKNLEVLILDDCSTDGSRAVIERYCEEHPDRVRALFNDRNSGNVFRQWRKGIENSAGELVWICESDDFCEPDFLEGLVNNFKDRSVNIAFGRIQFSDAEGNLRQGLDNYRERAEPGIWDSPLTRPARRWFAGGFGVNNVIPNVGGCIFRRQSLPEPVWDEAENYSILGDWFLYCHLAGGGQIAYEPSAVAYFRQHGGNTSVTSFVTPGYYEEHERLMLLLRRQWGVPDETVEAFHHKVAWQYAHHELQEKLGPLESYCDKQKLLAQKRTRPHILVAFLGFHPGGGEVFPIDLANELHAQGHLVSMLAFDMTDVKQEMLDALNPAIAVYDCAWVYEYGADRFLAEAGISVIHSHMISLESFFFEKCRIETKIPYLVTLHGSYEAPTPSDERLMRFVLGVTHFVYTADKNLEPFRPLPLSERIFTKFRNARPVDPRPFPKTRRELGIAEDAVVFTLVARGIKRKGWRAAIAAFQGLREAHPGRNMHLLLCGEGEEVDRQSALHGDDPDITFLGYQSRIHGLYRLSDVAIVPTRFAGESFPFCIIEALQTGTPVIATRIGEIGSMLEGPEGTAGILIEYQRDTDLFIGSLKEAMAAMLDASERERYALMARKRGEAYSMAKVTRDYVALYENMLAEAAH